MNGVGARNFQKLLNGCFLIDTVFFCENAEINSTFTARYWLLVNRLLVIGEFVTGYCSN